MDKYNQAGDEREEMEMRDLEGETQSILCKAPCSVPQGEQK